MSSQDISKDTPNGSESGPSDSPSDASSQIALLEAQLKEKDAKYLYLYADFENYKKRAIKERSDLLKFGWEGLARELVEVIDNLERAIAHMPETTNKTLVDGLHMVIQQFRATLEKQGVSILHSLDQSFDPNVHEAIGEEPSEKPAGKIVREQQKGYTLHGRLLRPSQVVISAGDRAQQ
jgi:molecular chaperone GrpE